MRLPNKEMQLTRPGQVAASQLISGVSRTTASGNLTARRLRVAT
jgi:hypothetical protein